MSEMNWRKVLAVHVSAAPAVTKSPGFIVYRDPKEVLEERTMIIHAIEEHERLITESIPDEDEIEELVLELCYIFRVLH